MSSTIDYIKAKDYIKKKKKRCVSGGELKDLPTSIENGLKSGRQIKYVCDVCDNQCK